MDEGKDLCETCGGVMASENGTDYFKPNSAYAYYKTDQTSAVLQSLPPLLSGLDGSGAVVGGLGSGVPGIFVC